MIQFALYEGHLISKQTLVSELKTYKLVDQYLSHTGKGRCNRSRIGI